MTIISVARLSAKSGPCSAEPSQRVSESALTLWLQAISGNYCAAVWGTMQVFLPSHPQGVRYRVKTDKRGCRRLARLHRAGDLVAVWVPHGGRGEACV